jgi:hypothetical protein
MSALKRSGRLLEHGSGAPPSPGAHLKVKAAISTDRLPQLRSPDSTAMNIHFCQNASQYREHRDLPADSEMLE